MNVPLSLCHHTQADGGDLRRPPATRLARLEPRRIEPRFSDTLISAREVVTLLLPPQGPRRERLLLAFEHSGMRVGSAFHVSVSGFHTSGCLSSFCGSGATFASNKNPSRVLRLVVSGSTAAVEPIRTSLPS